MSKQMPKYMTKKVERMCALMEQIVSLNMELEEWLEANGIENGYDFTYEHRDDRGYAVWNVESFVEAVNAELS